MTPCLEQASRWAAQRHDGPSRKGRAVPDVDHEVAVALMLDRAGFDGDGVNAGLLHDVTKDTAATLDDLVDRPCFRSCGVRRLLAACV
jgi:(p)ppGpp synthase/HD superfamily hydrolase